MRNNLGTLDRIVRFAGGLLLLAAAATLRSTGLALIGLFTLYEAFAGWCILYQILKINTCSIGKRKPLFMASNYFSGVIILLSAIGLNMLSGMVGLSSWYDFLQNPRKTLSMDNYLYLFIVYPYLLGWVSTLVKTINSKAQR